MNKQDFYHLKEQLIKHHRKLIDNDCTADPVFVVKTKHIRWGYEKEYAHCSALYFDDCYHEYVEDYLEGYDDEDIMEMCKGTNETPETLREMDLEDFAFFLEYTLVDKSYREDAFLVHGREEWKTHNMFLTRKAADEYVEKRCDGLDNPNVKIWTESWWRNYEMMSLLNAIMDGKLVWKEEG